MNLARRVTWLSPPNGSSLSARIAVYAALAPFAKVAMWSSKPVPTEQSMPPSLYECALGLKSCTGPSSMRVDQLTLLNTWPLFVLIGLVGAVVLWVLYSPSHSPPPPRRPPMPKVSPKKDADKEVDLAEPTRLVS